MIGKGGAPIYNNRKRGRERRKGHGWGNKKNKQGRRKGLNEALSRRLRENGGNGRGGGKAWQGAAKKPEWGSQPPTERTEAMGREAQDDHFRGSK